MQLYTMWVIEIKACYRGLSTCNTQNTYTAIAAQYTIVGLPEVLLYYSDIP